MAEQKVTLAAANMQVEHSTPENMKKIIGFIEEAAEKEASLLVFPECSLQGYLWTYDWKKMSFRDDPEQRRYFHEVAETIPGSSTETIEKYAKRYKMLIQIGMVERVNEKGKAVLRNAAALVGPEGLVGVFRKVHSEAEHIIFRRGNELPVFKTFVGKIGPIICADLNYPETVRLLALKGAEIITMSTAWGMDPRTDNQGYRYDLLTRTNALMNGVWLVSSDQIGTSKTSAQVRERLGLLEGGCFGHSRIVDPTGNIIAGLGYEEGLVTATVDVKGAISKLEPRWPVRYPELYTAISTR